MSFESICLSILSGIMASLFFYLGLFLVKPRVKVSDKICVEHNSSSTIARIKIVNLTISTLINLHYSLYYCDVNRDGINEIIEIKPMKDSLHTICRYSFKKDKTDYAVRFTYDLGTEYIPKDDSKLIFVFTANHSFSNTARCITKEYYFDDIVDGFFESDKSTKVIMKKNAK